MAFVCALSNEVPETPVVSPVSGALFERRLVEKALQENGGKDPVNGEPLAAAQLVELKVPAFVKPKAPTATSIPGILKGLQDEWDAIMLGSFTMKQQLDTARKELSHALYQHDAACRVIARLMKEASDAKDALTVLKPQQVAEPLLADDGPVGFSQELHQKLEETAGELTRERKRKGKVIPPNLASADDIKEYKAGASYKGLHSASSPGILCLDVSNDLVVTGGNDKLVSIFSKSKKQIVTSFKGHTKKILSVVCHPVEQLVMSGSMDSTARIWHVPTAHCIQQVGTHDGPITGLSLHPTGDYLLLSSMDKHWSFVDLITGTIYAKVLGDEENPLTSAQFHPDGLIFATGTGSAEVKIWDLKNQESAATFRGHQGPVTSIAFSENGYYLATAAEDSSVKLWDLRKLKNIKTIQMEDGFSITDVAFDNSGTYLALSGNDVRVFACKSWNEIAIFSEHTATATGVRFGPDAEWIASVSMDRSLKFYSNAK